MIQETTELQIILQVKKSILLTCIPRRIFHTPTFSNCPVKTNFPDASVTILHVGEDIIPYIDDGRYRRYVFTMF